MKKCLALLLLLCLALPLAAALADEQAEAYLEEYFGVRLDAEDAVSPEEFSSALAALGTGGYEGGDLTLADAVVSAVRAGGLTALALSYENEAAPDKARALLEEEGVSVSAEDAPYVALALSLGWAESEADFAGPVSAEDAAWLLYQAMEVSGRARRFIGRIGDDGILTAVLSALSGAIIFDEASLSVLGQEIVLRGATTGYGLKYEGAAARFLAENTIQYSHSDADHAVQLLALLAGEGMDGYVQIEPKVSVYEYLPEWGDPGAPTPTSRTVQVTEDRYLTYAVEYDLMIEFDSTEEKEAFHGIIETYAKKYDSSFDADGNLVSRLIDGAWWQPLYSSRTEMEDPEFRPLVDNVVYSLDGAFSIHPFSLPERQEAVAAVCAEVAPALPVGPQTLYVNPAFYRYITGEDYQ